MFSSPTGTGKSLSLICSSLKWLRDHEKQSEIDELQSALSKLEKIPILPKEPLWIRTQTIEKQKKVVFETIRIKRERRDRLNTKLKAIRTANSGTQESKRQKIVGLQELVIRNDYMLESYESDGDNYNEKRRLGIENELVESDDEDIPPSIQIIYSSRTHSQLAQFVHELKKTNYADARCVTLGSRRNLCIHDKVLELKSNTRINDACKDLQSGPESARCPYLLKNSSQLQEFADQTHAVIRDIEELSVLGRKTRTCSYYGSRESVKNAEIICVPYNILLNEFTREASGLKIEGNIVIIDEAHNVSDSITSIHSVCLEEKQVT